MESAGQVVSAFNGRVIKEPRGFIKVIEWVLAIFAFATTTSFSSSTTFSINCEPIQTVKFLYSYPFDLKEISFQVPETCNDTTKVTTVHLLAGATAPAQFYVFVGVIVFLYCMAALVLYMFFDDMYRRNTRMVIGDFIISVVLTILWLISSSAWAQGVTDVKEYTDPFDSNMFENPRIIPVCAQPDMCKNVELGNFAGLNVSLIFGFLNFAVWVGNLWFLFKETPWFKGSSQQTDSDPTTMPPSSNI